MAVLDPDTTSRARVSGLLTEVGLQVGVAGPARSDVLSLVRRTGCHAVLLVADGEASLAPQLAVDLECPMVLCSAETGPGMVRLAQRLGAMAFLVEPIRREEIAPTLGLAIARFRERQQLQRALEDRKIIERAKGRLMALQGTSEEDAFKWLRRRAMDTRTRLADVALEVVNGGMPSRGASTAVRSPAAVVRSSQI